MKIKVSIKSLVVVGLMISIISTIAMANPINDERITALSVLDSKIPFYSSNTTYLFDLNKFYVEIVTESRTDLLSSLSDDNWVMRTSAETLQRIEASTTESSGTVILYSGNQLPKMISISGLNWIEAYSFTEHDLISKKFQKILFTTTPEQLVHIKIGILSEYVQQTCDENPEFFERINASIVGRTGEIWAWSNKGNSFGFEELAQLIDSDSDFDGILNDWLKFINTVEQSIQIRMSN